LRDFGQHCVNVNKKTPTEVGPPSLTTNFQCPATTIAHNQPNGASQSKTPGEGQGWQVVWLGVQAFNSLIQEVNSRFVRVRTKPSLL
jgi:hypothetical protein